MTFELWFDCLQNAIIKRGRNAIERYGDREAAKNLYNDGETVDNAAKLMIAGWNNAGHGYPC